MGAIRWSRGAAALLLAGVWVLAGCAEWMGNRKVRHTSSVVEYLYPGRPEASDQPTVPTLKLPMAVGVAFVPESAKAGPGGLSEEEKMALLERVTAQFKEYSFIRSIELIPTAYLVPAGGFANLDQVRTMYGVDAVALLSYDQVQHTDEGLLSVTYWTVVGAYLFKGEKNDTSTLVDAAVYHVESRKLLFRAPGTSRVQGTATPVNLSEQLRKDSRAGFEQASEGLVANLKAELERFRARVKESPQDYQVVHRPGYTGGGAVGGVEVALVAAIVGAGLWLGRGRRG